MYPGRGQAAQGTQKEKGVWSCSSVKGLQNKLSPTIRHTYSIIPSGQPGKPSLLGPPILCTFCTLVAQAFGAWFWVFSPCGLGAGGSRFGIDGLCGFRRRREGHNVLAFAACARLGKCSAFAISLLEEMHYVSRAEASPKASLSEL